jgi:predicted RNase H-like nuclease (RuvC/YqgF family)
MFMALETYSNEDEDNDNIPEIGENDDVDVDLEGELLCALDEIKRLRRKNRQLKEELSHNSDLASQLEEQKKIEEEIKSQLQNKEEDCEKLEKENTSLRKEIDIITTELNNSLKFERSSMMLDNMLNNQRSPFDKTGLGYNPNSTLQKTKEEPKSYVVALNNPIEHDENTNEANHDQQSLLSFTGRMNSER